MSKQHGVQRRTAERTAVAVARKAQRCAGKFRRVDSGSIVILAALLLPLLLGVAALVIDSGFLFDVKRDMQTAADNAAVGAALEVKRGSSWTTIVEAARADAADNDFPNGVDDIDVAVNRPPTRGAYAGDNGFIEVEITQPRAPFIPILRTASTTVRARAVAGCGSSGAACLLALKPSGSNAIVVSGGGVINAGSDCAVVVNSADPNGLVASGGSCVSAGEIRVSGNAVSGSCYTPEVQLSAPPTPDPFDGLAAPPAFGCTHNGSGTCPDSTTTCKVHAVPGTLYPGVYCGGIFIDAGAVVTMEPGVYVMAPGKNFGVSGSATMVSGSGVTIYMSAGAGKFTASGGPTLNLAAPTGGEYEAMLIFQDPGNTNKVVFSGGTSMSIEGAIYAKNSQVEYSGGSNSSAAYTMIVSNTMVFSGTSKLGSDFSKLEHPLGAGTKVALAE